MMGLRSRALTGSILLALLAGVGCSSTTESGARDPRDAEAPSEALVDEPELSSDEEATRASAPSSEGVPGAQGGRESGASATAGGSRSTSSGETGLAARIEGEIEVGIEVTTNTRAAFALVGADASSEDQRALVESVVKYINTNGGAGGRNIVPVIHGSDPTAQPWPAQAQAACSTFTEDHEVSVAIGKTNDRDDLLACLSAKGIPLIGQNRYLFDERAFADHRGLFYLPGRMNATRLARNYVNDLADQGFFEDGVLGLLRFDRAVFERVTAETVIPTLASHGVKVAEEVVITTPNGVADFGSMSAELGNAVIRLRSRGVDRVLFVEFGGIIPFFFMPEAESQGYRPRYGLQSLNVPVNLEANVPSEQLRGSVGVGWSPTEDVDFAQDPGPTDGMKLCMDIYKDAGFTFDDRISHTVAISYCDSLLFLKAALDRADTFDAPGLRAGVERLDTSFSSPFTFATGFGPSRHDGARVGRRLAFDNGCACYRYLGDPFAV